MHKPYALAPCGHTTCYDCLVRWFTAPQNLQQQLNANAADPNQYTVEHILNSAPARNGAFIRRRKNCPVCRAVVGDRPIEMWGIKSMVSALVRSKLVDLPALAAEPDPPPPAAGGAAANNNRDNNDPWRNLFRRVGARNRFGFALEGGPGNPYGAPQALGGAGADNGGQADPDQMGWFDMEDGGIYRCTDCYHEIWDGVCTACNRRYPGHHMDDDDGDDIEFDDDDDDDDDGEDHDDDDEYDGHFRGGFGRFLEAIMDHDGGEDIELMEEQIEMEEEMRVREEVRQQIRHLEEHGVPAEGWLDDGDPHAVALFNELIAQGDDDEGEGAEEDSQYGGSFIDDEAAEEVGEGSRFQDDESDEEVEFVEPPPPNNTRRPARRTHVVVESSDDEDNSEAEDHRVVSRQLGRGARIGRHPIVAPPPPRGRRVVQVSEDEEEELSSLHISDNDEPQTYEACDDGSSGLDSISEGEDVDGPETYGTDEEREQRAVVDEVDDSGSSSSSGEEQEVVYQRSGRPIRRGFCTDSDDSD
jgi:hypothetical protein